MKPTKTFFIFIASFIYFATMSLPVMAQMNKDDIIFEPAEIMLSLKDISQIALENNLDIQITKYDASIKRTDLSQAQSLFDTVFTAGTSYFDDQTKNSSTLLGTKATTNDYTVGISKKIPSGTTLGLDVGDKRSFTNSSFAAINPSHEATVKFSLHQPLGQNFLGLIDRGNIKVTKIEVENYDSQALGRIEQTLAQAQKAYWQVVLRNKELLIANEMLKKAQVLYDIFKEKNALGLIEDAELFAAEANVAKRQADVLLIRHQLVLAKNELLFALHEEDLDLKIIPSDVFDVDSRFFIKEHSLQQAIAGRRDYKQAKNDVEAKRINLSMKKNNLWPQIDFEASFAHNGLEISQNKTWENITQEDNPELYAGITMSVPLENTAARSAHKKARLEKTKALLKLRKTEHKILIDISNEIDSINNKIEKIKLNNRIVELQTKKLEFEENRFSLGRSGSDTLIRYQEDLLQAKLMLAQTVFEYKKALIDLKLAENSLLDEYWQGKL